MNWLEYVAARQRKVVQEVCWLAIAVVNFIVSAQWQGWNGDNNNATIAIGAVVIALVIDGGMWVSLHLFNSYLFKPGARGWAGFWFVGVALFGLLTFHNNYLYLAGNYNVNLAALAQLGLDKGSEDTIRSGVLVVAMFFLAFVPPVKVKIDEQAEEDAHRRKMRKLREKQEERALSVGGWAQTLRAAGAALSEGQKAEQNLMLNLRAELRRLGVAETGESDQEVKLRAAEAQIYDPSTNTFKPRPQPKALPPRRLDLLPAAEEGDTAPQTTVQGKQYYTAKQIHQLTAWPIRTVRHRMEPGWKPSGPYGPEYKIKVWTGVERPIGSKKYVAQEDPRIKLPGTGRYADQDELTRLLGLAAIESTRSGNGHTEAPQAAVWLEEPTENAAVKTANQN